MLPIPLKYILSVLFVLCGCISSLSAQNAPPFAFRASQSIPVYRDSDLPFSFPWTGGFNACHLASIDLNEDEIPDLVLYDRIGFRIRPFLYQDHMWQYAPEYIQSFPTIYAWMQFHDYDADGYPDLFTFNGVAGIAVYRNTRAEKGYLSFEMQTKAIQSLMFESKTSLYCTNVDYPIFADIDQDGDLDILNFWVPTTGDYLLYYKNISQETYGHSDSLSFVVEDWSWGCFAESNESNVIYLDTCQSENTKTSQRQNRMPQKHSGSTLLALKKGNTYDILLGDVGYSNVIHLLNDGTPNKAHIGAYHERFPEQDPIELNSFPVLSTFTILGEENANLLASPFAIDPFHGQGRESLWRYTADTKNESIPEFHLSEKDFLQKQTIDLGNGAYPVFVDLNGDGLQDLIVGNYNIGDSGSYSQLAYFQNTGTKTNPVFTLITDDFAAISSYKIRAASPTFGDVDNDEKIEMFLGTEDGRIFYFKNRVNVQSETMNYVLEDSLYNRIRVGSFAAPQLFDLNKDGLQDLIIGERRKVWSAQPKNITKGNLNYYQNIGTVQIPEFKLVSDSLGGVDVIDRMFSNFGYARPCFYRDDKDLTYLFCGSENGKIYFYDEIDGNLMTHFRQGDFVNYTQNKQGYPIAVGIHSSPCVFDIDGDGLLDMIVGNQAGGLEFFQGINKKEIDNEVEILESSDLDIKLYPIPCRNDLFVQYKGRANYRIYDLQGRCLLSGIFMGDDKMLVEHTISMQKLPKGFLVLVIGNAQSSKAYKIIRQ